MARSDKVTFPGHDGSLLAARLDTPKRAPRAYALFAHCFSCSKDIFAANRIAKRLVANGIAVLRFDFTGLGASEGDFANTNFTSNIRDLVAAANWLGENHGNVDLLIGHSLGGAAVIVAATELPTVKAVATVGAPSDAEHVLHQFAPHIDDIESEGQAEVNLAGRPFTIKKQFVEDVRGAKVRDAAAALKRPLLVMHSPLDNTVSIDNATGLFVAAKHPKSFISLDDADHLLTRKEDALYVADAIAAWASPYLGTADEVAVPAAPSAREQVRVQETGLGGYDNWVLVADHVLRADEPADLGGTDMGPTPFEYLAAALGSCTSITVRMYANRKGWPLEGITVDVDHEKSETADETGWKTDIYTRRIKFQGPLDEDQVARLLEIADKCPVHRSLHHVAEVKTELFG